MLRFGTILLIAAALVVRGQDSTETVGEQNRSIVTEQNRSALDVKPGEQTIKDKDLFDRTGYLHPFTRLPRFVVVDQKNIWTSPFHTSRKDAKYWLIFGGAVGTLYVFDETIQKNAPNPHWLQNLGTNGSLLGAAYTL